MRFTVISSLFLASTSLGLVLDYASSETREVKLKDYYNRPYDGTPVSWFTANSSLPISKLVNATRNATQVLDNYPTGFGKKSPRVNIYGDWSKFANGSAFFFTADMDVDCDGMDYKCPGNGDGQALTTFGALAAYAVPFVVIPDRFYNAHAKEIAGNNVVAVLCNGQMLYGIFGDTDGDSPQVIGEASWRMASACFPKEGTNGNKGHGPVDVTCWSSPYLYAVQMFSSHRADIFFTGPQSVLPSAAMSSSGHYILNYTVLRTMGDRLVGQLSQQLQLA